MGKEVLDTVILNDTEGSGGGTPSQDKFVFWGATLKTENFTSNDVLSLVKKEQRSDRFFSDDNWDSAGAYMTAAIPIQYASSGLFRDINTGFSLPFASKGIVQITDSLNNTYDVEVFQWGNKSYKEDYNIESI